MKDGGGTRSPAWERLASELLSVYAQVFFARGRSPGLLCAAATFTVPRVGVCGLLAVLIASGAARLLKLDPTRIARGDFGYNALLAGLAVGAFVGGAVGVGTTLALVALAASVALLGHAAIESAFGGLLQLPALTLPFVGAAWLALLVAPRAHVTPPEGIEVHGAITLLPGSLSLYLESLGAMFFVPSVLAGALVLWSLLMWSRIAALLSLVGFAAAQIALALLAPAESSHWQALVVGYNGAAAAMALGGVWFVPQRESFVLGALAAVLASALALALSVLLAPHDLPVLILPFNFTLPLVLLAMRQRTHDGAPKAVDFEPGTPEANLNYYRTRVARFGARSAIRFRLPFSGRWTVTQGVDGAHTHQREWRHALDFEATDELGATFEGAGASLKDYFSYRLPVLASAAGTVVKVVNHVPDNPPGERNPRDPWGNLVIVQHGPALYSLVAHLSPGSVEVSEGQFVVAGARLGACGNSGRSFVPHIHFHLQSGPRPGAPTVELELADVVAGDDEHGVARLHRFCLPREGQVVRALEPRDEVAALFQLPIGARMRFEVEERGAAARSETLTTDLDFFNTSFLESDAGGRLYFERQPQQLMIYDQLGGHGRVLPLLYAALPRVPFEAAGRLTWDDVLPSRSFRGGRLGWLIDFVDPFLRGGGPRLEFRAHRDGASLVIEGRGESGGRAIETRAVLRPGLGVCEVELKHGEVVSRARRIDSAAMSEPSREAAA